MLTSSQNMYGPSRRKRKNILPLIMNLQITGRSLSQSKDFLRATARYLNVVVKPRKLQDLVKSVHHLRRRVFLGFLKGSYWLLSYQYMYHDENFFDQLQLQLDNDNVAIRNRSPGACVLEFWLYHPGKPLKLKFVRDVFKDLDSCWIDYPEELKFTVYQWVERPEHILVFGEKGIVSSDNSRPESCSVLSITYLPVPNLTSPNTCPMCSKAQSLLTFRCVVHDCLLDFLSCGGERYYDKTDREKHLKIPNAMYLATDPNFYYVSMTHGPIPSEGLPKDSYGNMVSNLRTTVYNGYVTSLASDVKGVTDDCDDFTVKCTTHDGQFFLPVSQPNEGTDDPPTKSTQSCLILRRSWLELQLLIIEKVYPIMSERTSWFNPNCELKDWVAEYIEICADTGIAICEMTFKIGEDPRYFEPFDRHICSVTFLWNVHTGDVQITKFDEGVLVWDDRDPKTMVILRERAHNPLWLNRLSDKHKQPRADKSLLELNNVPYVKGESLTRLMSLDRTAVISL